MYYVEGIPEKGLIKIAVKGEITLNQVIHLSDELLIIKETTIPGPHKAWICIADEVSLPKTKELQAFYLTITRAKLFGLQKAAIQIPPNDNLLISLTATMLLDIYTKLDVPAKIVKSIYEAELYLDDKWKT